MAKKYNVPVGTLIGLANREGWKALRDKAKSKIIARSEQKAAEVAADNATIAARLKRKMLLRLEREFDALPDSIGSEKHMDIASFEYEGRKLKKRSEGGTRYKLSDFTKAFKDLTDDMPELVEDKNAPIFELLKKLDGESDV